MTELEFRLQSPFRCNQIKQSKKTEPMKTIKKLRFAALAGVAVALLVQTTITHAAGHGKPVSPSNPYPHG